MSIYTANQEPPAPHYAESAKNQEVRQTSTFGAHPEDPNRASVPLPEVPQDAEWKQNI